jgi:hypothetical protein
MKHLFLAAAAICISTTSILADLTVGQSYSITLNDIDGHAFATADGHFTTIVLVSKANADKAHAVGDRTPDFCLEAQHSRPVRAFLTAMMRRRVESESKQLQSRYDKLKIARNARQDVFAVADFDGAICQQLDTKPGAALFRVFAFGKNGELLKQWNDLPSSEELAAALKEN